MKKTSFKEFIDKKKRESIRQLRTVKKVLDHGGFTTEAYFTKDDPYLFVYSNNDQLTFAGVRVYKIGDTLAYRIQKDKETHPYGNAYSLNIEEMYNDLISENGNEQEAGERIISAITAEFISFFKKSGEAEEELSQDDVDSYGKVVSNSGVFDLSTNVSGQMS